MGKPRNNVVEVNELIGARSGEGEIMMLKTG